MSHNKKKFVKPRQKMPSCIYCVEVISMVIVRGICASR